MFSKTLKNGKEDFLDQNLDKLIFGLQLTIKYRKIEVKITYKMSSMSLHSHHHLRNTLNPRGSCKIKFLWPHSMIKFGNNWKKLVVKATISYKVAYFILENPPKMGQLGPF